MATANGPTDRILAAIAGHRGGIQAGTIATKTGIKRRTVNATLRELELTGQVFREGSHANTCWFDTPPIPRPEQSDRGLCSRAHRVLSGCLGEM